MSLLMASPTVNTTHRSEAVGKLAYNEGSLPRAEGNAVIDAGQDGVCGEESGLVAKLLCYLSDLAQGFQPTAEPLVATVELEQIDSEASVGVRLAVAPTCRARRGRCGLCLSAEHAGHYARTRDGNGGI
jgi:hypothetical protein